MAIFTNESLDTLRQRVDLVEVLSVHIELKAAGSSYKGLCPFHDEKTPSFMVHRGDTHYHCFGCGAHGDAIQFLMTHLKMSFVEAVENLAEQFHVQLEEVENSKEKKGPSKTLLKEALEIACNFYHFCLLHTPEGHEALQYLYQRGLDLEFIQQFQIGFAPSTPGLFRKVMHGKGVTDYIMQEAGLLRPRQGGGFRDFFSDRITFPVRHASGPVIGFSARKYKEETFGGKYVNTPETVLFKKSRVLFGLNYSRRRIAKDRQAIVVEGQVDALRLIQKGFNIAVAGQGTAFGEEHVKELISLGVQEVFLAMDSDDAGQEAACKIGDLFQKAGVGVRVIQMPVGLDPDAFLQEQGEEAFQKLLEEGIEYIPFLVEYRSRYLDMTSPAGKNALIQSVAQQIREWGHPLMQHESLRKLAHLTHVPEEMVNVAQHHSPNLFIKTSASIGVQTIDPNRILELDFLRWLVLMGEKEPKFAEIAQANVRPEALTDSACRRVYQTILTCVENQEAINLLLVAASNEEVQAVVAELFHKKVNQERAEEHFMETVQKILNRNWMEEREVLRKKIQSGECSEDEVMDLLRQFDSLKANPPKVSAV